MAEHIELYNPNNGQSYGVAPTPKTSSGSIDINDNSNKIATTEWVNANNFVKTVNGSSPDADGNTTIFFAPTVFNTRLVITSSNATWTPPVTGWARVTVIGGGGAGGGGGSYMSPSIYGGGKGGGQGGTTSFGNLTAAGGSGGGGGSWCGNDNGAGGGGGEAGKVVQDYVFINIDRTISVTIGAGGIASTLDPSPSLNFGTVGEGLNGGNVGSYSPTYKNGLYGGGGAPGAGSGSIQSEGYAGGGGSGGVNGTGYGGGGGGGAGYNFYDHPTLKPAQGQAGDGGSTGYYTSNGRSFAGNGGPGAIIIEYYDPKKEVA